MPVNQTPLVDPVMYEAASLYHPKFLALIDRVSELQASSMDVYNVKAAAYGAAGDGSHDDTAAIQGAMDDAAGGTVFIPPGIYKITNKLSLPSNIVVQGCGRASILKAYFATERNCLLKNDWVSGNAGIVLRDFRLDRDRILVEGTPTSTTAHGMIFNGVDGLLIDGVEVVGVSKLGGGCCSVSEPTVCGGATVGLLSRNVRVASCYMEDTINFGVELGYVRQAAVIGNNFKNAYREVIGVEPGVGLTAEGVAIIGNVIETGAIPVVGSNTPTGVIIATRTSYGNITGVVIIGNTIRGVGTTALDTNPGISCLGGSGYVVANNTIATTAGGGMRFGSLTTYGGVQYGAVAGAVVVGNRILDVNQGTAPDELESPYLGAGFSLRRATYCKVSGNIVSGADTATYGLIETDACDYNDITDNRLDGHLDALVTVGTHTRAYGNRGAAGLSVTGSRGSNAALTSLLLRLEALGIIDDNTS